MDIPTAPSGASRPASASHPVRTLAMRIAPLARPLAGSRLFPLWGMLGHTGRRSGRAYETPIVALARPGGYLIPLPFGPATQWTQNLLASGTGTMRHKGRTVTIGAPEIIPLEVAGAALPGIIRFASRCFGIHSYVRVQRVPAD